MQNLLKLSIWFDQFSMFVNKIKNESFLIITNK